MAFASPGTGFQGLKLPRGMPLLFRHALKGWVLQREHAELVRLLEAQRGHVHIGRDRELHAIGARCRREAAEQQRSRHPSVPEHGALHLPALSDLSCLDLRSLMGAAGVVASPRQARMAE